MKNTVNEANVLPLISISCKQNREKCKQKHNITITATFRDLIVHIARTETLAASSDTEALQSNSTIDASPMAAPIKTSVANDTFVHGTP